MIRNTAQTKQTNIAPNTILPSLSGRAHQLTIPATATLAMGSLFIGSLSSVKTTACTNPRLGSTGWNTFTCCWTAPKRHINKWVRIIPTITVGQRKKVTAVTFFRCPTVTMRRMKQLSLWMSCALALPIVYGNAGLSHLPLDKMADILTDDNFECIFLNENDRIQIQISLKFVPRSPIDNKPA